MTCTTHVRMRAIHSRTRRYRAHNDARQLSCLAMCGTLLLAGINLLLRTVQSPGVAAVADGFGAVLLKDGAGAYIVVGLAAFAAGVAATVLCVRMTYKTNHRADRAEESED